MARRRAADSGPAGDARKRSARPAGRLRVPRRSDAREELVRERTGRTRAAWFAVLDAFDARTHGHSASAAHLRDAHGVPPWWAQALTVEYERTRGIRSPAGDDRGFECTVQRALGVPVERLWEAFADPEQVSAWIGARHRHRLRERSRWRDDLGARGAFVRIVEGRFVRFTWNHPERCPRSAVDVEFRSRGEGRSIVKVTHWAIGSAEEREDLRAHWSWALDSMKSFVETGAPVAHHVWAAAQS